MKATNQDDKPEILQKYYGFSSIIPFGRVWWSWKGPSFVVFTLLYDLSPWIHLANWISFGWMVMCFMCMAHRFESSINCTKYTSAASCSVITIAGVTLNPIPNPCTISQTRRWNGSLRISNSVDFWYFRISLNATVPGWYLCGWCCADGLPA